MTTSPRPEVLYLPAIFREIRAGRIRVPAFQRGFVWRRQQALALLDSVRRSYPVGSLLFWHVDQSAMRTDKSGDLPFPHPDAAGSVDFILDGMQRLSALYGAFHAPAHGTEDEFAVAYDLRTSRFLPIPDATESCIDLRTLFAPRALLDEQARLVQLAEGEALVDAAVDLQRTFQEYLLPVVRIGARSPKEVVEIFERVNSTGTRLSAVDFMRALTWSDEFDLTAQIQRLADVPELYGFNIPQDTLAKCIALAMDVVPRSDEMIRLREQPADALLRAAERTRKALVRVGAFLKESLGILSYDFVPYEGQFLTLVCAVTGLSERAPLPNWMVQWFWKTGFSESFFGRPDQTIAKNAWEIRESPNGRPEEHFNLDKARLRTRSVRKGAALPMSVYAALALGPARSVLSGMEIPPSELVDGYDFRSIATVFSGEELTGSIDPPPNSDKLISNVVLLSRDERRVRWDPREIRAHILALGDTVQGRFALASQCVDEACLDALSRANCEAFLRARAGALAHMARRLSGA